ncbi:MAG TPA: sugar phosphate isomerase/epimerase [Candidatus Omnitrophica bacterium]|nr:sugar phosphate isomerase/epimerase [Candidatus Omnitrophota bacterium]
MFFSGISDEAGKSIEVQINAHKELGWNYMEIRNVDGENLTLMDDAKFEEIYRKVTSAGMKVSCFASCLANWSRPISNNFQVDLNELKQAIPRMQKFGTEFIRIMSWPNDEKNPWKEERWRDEAIRRIRELAKIAEDGGITMVHENCAGWAGESPENTLEMLDRVNSPALKLVYDTGNVIDHNQDPWDFYSKVKEHIVYVHIKDAIREGDEFKPTYCGEGQGMVKEIIADLKKSNYQGGLSIEPHLSAMVHKGEEASSESAYQIYLTYGRKLMEIVENL